MLSVNWCISHKDTKKGLCVLRGFCGIAFVFVERYPAKHD
jgi:hypothetical protein